MKTHDPSPQTKPTNPQDKSISSPSKTTPNPKIKIPRKTSVDSTSSTANELDEGHLFLNKGVDLLCRKGAGILMMSSLTLLLAACSTTHKPTTVHITVPDSWHYDPTKNSSSSQIHTMTANPAWIACSANGNTAPNQFVWSPNNTSEATTHTASEFLDDIACSTAWWYVFDDASLNTFIQSLLTHNQELHIATLNLQKSLQNAQKDKSTLYPVPTINAQANKDYEHNAKTHATTNTEQASLGLSASWELDLWGKLAKQNEAAQYEVLASQADKQAVYMSLSANGVRSYLQLAHLNEQLDTSSRTLEHLSKLHQMQKIRLQAGRIAKIDLIESEQAINQHEQNHLSLQNQKHELITTLSALFNLPAQSIEADWGKVRFPQSHLPEVQIGIPATTIANRPDMQAATWRLKAALLMPDITKASLYPNIVLTAKAGSASNQLTELLKIPVLNWGIALNLPPLNPSEARRTLHLADITKEQAIINYQDSVYKALADIESKLSAFTHQQQNLALVHRQQQNALALQSANQIRHKAGTLTIKEVLESEENLRQANMNVHTAQLNRYLTWIALYQSMGGDFYEPLIEDSTYAKHQN